MIHSMGARGDLTSAVLDAGRGGDAEGDADRDELDKYDDEPLSASDSFACCAGGGGSRG